MGQILLDRNENQYGPSPACYEVLRTANLEQLSFYSREFARGRKSLLSQRLSERLGIPEERILLSYGSEDMLKQVVHCYLHKGERLLLPQQSWWYYKKIANEVLGNHVEYPLREQGNRFVFDVDEIIRLHDKHQPHLILVASPNNPTGSSMPAEDVARLINHCTNSYIVLDQAYFGFDGSGRDTIRELLDAHGRLIILRTFSKYYALAGLRIGYTCIGRDIKRLVEFGARYLGYNQLTERIALAALEDEDYYRRITEAMNESKAMFLEEFGKLEGFKPFASDSNFMMVRYPIERKQDLVAGLKENGVAVKFLDDPGVNDCIRITIGTRAQNEYVMNVFKSILHQHGAFAEAVR